ncbi:MAG: TonB-dependent receptor [Candidatus Aminicenantales bacterium]
MKKAFGAICLFHILIICGISSLAAQVQTGAIQGIVVDKSGHPIAGATVYLSSSAMLGSGMAMTGKAGGFDFPDLAAGTYTVSAEMPGFQSYVRDRIILSTGMSFFFRLELGPAEEEVVVTAPDRPTALDLVSSKIATVQDQTILHNIPLARDFGAVLSMAPGVISWGSTFRREASIQGGPVGDNGTTLDGINLSDIFSGAPLLDIGVDLMDEIEVISAGQPASRVPAGGAAVNVVSKSGSNSYSGEWGFYFIDNDWNRNLWSPAQVKELGVGPPAGDKNLFESSLSLSGPIWEDRIWYFLAGRYNRRSMVNNFVGPFQDILGRNHYDFDNEDWFRQDISGFFKFTVRPLSNATFTAWADLANTYQPSLEDPSPRLPFLSTHILDHEKSLAFYGAASYYLNQNTLASARVAYLKRTIPTLLQTDALSLPWSDDAGDLYGPLSGADYNSETTRQRVQANASLRVFLDNILGTAHTLSLGVDFDNSISNLDWWRQDNLLWYMDSRNPKNYFYADRGRLGFWLCGSSLGSTLLSGQSQQLGVSLTDSFPVAGRLSFSLGLRFDRSWGWFTAGSKVDSGNPLSVFIGDALISPYVMANYPDDFPEGFNPWAAATWPELKDIISWNTLSPRAGLAFDVWGNGKTKLSASYALYPDSLSHRTLLPLHPLYPQNIEVNWLDTNGNGRPDAEDEFSLAHLDFRYLAASFSKYRVASDIKAPSTEEISVGLEQEVFKDFTLGLHFISKQQRDILEDVLYAPDMGEYWYAPDQASAQKYWVPFTTTVPGTDGYPSQTVTFYTKSLQAPPVFLQLRNVPELKRTYRALEFVFHKHMTQGWQLAGSLVLSRAEGNLGGSAQESAGLTAAANSPNYFINRNGPLDMDRPLQIKLMGTVKLPWGYWLSSSFQYRSGRPWQRVVQVLPPADWCAAHNVERDLYAFNLEAPGTRREKAWTSLDLRLEKEWPLGTSGTVGLYADVTNLLGTTDSLIGLNDIDRWEPAAEGAGQAGVKILQPNYLVTSAVYGRQTFRFGLRFDF